MTASGVSPLAPCEFHGIGAPESTEYVECTGSIRKVETPSRPSLNPSLSPPEE